MTPQQLDSRSKQLEERSQYLEERVDALEKELAELKEVLSALFQKKEPMWKNIVGSFETDPTFEEAVRIGREWRQTAE